MAVICWLSHYSISNMSQSVGSMDQATWIFWRLFPFGLLILARLCASASSDLQDRNRNCFSLFPRENLQLLPRRKQHLGSVYSLWQTVLYLEMLCVVKLDTVYTAHVFFTHLFRQGDLASVDECENLVPVVISTECLKFCQILIWVLI